MARGILSSRNFGHQRRGATYPTTSSLFKARKGANLNKTILVAQEKNEWQDATCSVCMEYPHNAVLLLCSSYEKGCRPYMCGTNCRHSNCLDQFRKAYTKEGRVNGSRSDNPSSNNTCEKSNANGLPCPLCRGQVKGWTVVKPARLYLNRKRRTCMHDGCSYKGTYKKLRMHVKSEHPLAKPREVDPTLEQKWKIFEHEREHQDVISTIRSTMPRSLVLGDYVIDFDSEDETGRGGGGVRGHRGISQSLMYLLMREGARLMTRQGNNTASEDADGSIADPSRSFPSDSDHEEIEVPLRRRWVGVRGPNRRRRHRQGQSHR